MHTVLPSSQTKTGRPAALDADAVRAAYRRWASIYDATFGSISAWGRRAAVGVANGLPGRNVLEVGVGTGLALPHYAADKRVTGIDLSRDMLDRARTRAAGLAADGLATVAALLEMDAEATTFADNQFDIAVAMFVASVVPHPRQLMAELRRVVRPGGDILFVNHFAAERGPRWWAEQAMAPASRALGWHPDFKLEALLDPAEKASAILQPIQPVGLFTLVRLRN